MKRQRILIVDDNRNELLLASRLLTPFHDIELLKTHKRACERVLDKSQPALDWVLIGYNPLGQFVGGGKDHAAEDLAIQVRNSEINAAVVHYYDFMVPPTAQLPHVKVFGKKKGDLYAHAFQCTDLTYVMFNVVGKLIRKDNVLDVLARCKWLLENPDSYKGESTCRNWRMIANKIGIPIPSEIEEPPQNAKPSDFNSPALKRRLRRGISSKSRRS